MDSDGFTTNRRRQRTVNEPSHDRSRNDFRRDVPKYQRPSEDYDEAHHRRYGREEGMSGIGDHGHGKPHFPHDSDRQRKHEAYSKTTDSARRAYNHYEETHEKYIGEHQAMEEMQRQHYTDHTGGLPPDRHERLFFAAERSANLSYRNAVGRDDFLRAHPVGFHDKEEADRHHRYADEAYGRYEYGDKQQKHHSRYRSDKASNSGLDRWGRPNPREP